MFDEIDHLILAAFRLDEFRAFLIELQETVAVFGKTEEIGLFLRPFDLAAAVRALAILELSLRPEGFAGGAIPAFVFALINFPFFIEGTENFLDRAHMIFIRRADEAVVADVEKFPEALEACDDLIHIFFWGNACFRSL